LNGHRLHHRLATSLVIVGGLLLLIGCGGLAGGSNGAGTVGVRNGSLDFGTVAIGDSKILPDTLSNNTSSAVTISSIQGLGPAFQVTGVTLPIVLAAGQNAPFSVQFQPTDPGNPTTTIAFNGTNAQPYVSLSASGTAVTRGKLSPSPSPVAFGNTKVGANQTSTVTLSNSGGTDLTITQATMSGAGFSMSNLALPLTVHAGKAASATITFAPTGSGNFSGSTSFAVTANQQNSKVVLNFSGAGVASGTLTPNPSSLTFGSIPVGSNSSQSETLTNTGGASVTISQATASGAGFSVSGLTLPVTLASNQSVTFNAIFAPAGAGAASGALNIVSDASNSPLSIPFSGTGLAPGSLSANPTSLAFGSVQLGNSAHLSETLTNTGGSTVTISQANLTGAVFSVSGLTLPLTLTANQSVTFTATFTPASAGAVSGSLSVVSNASNSPLNIALSGTGTAAGQLAVSPTGLSFGNVAVGSSSSLNGSLNASGASVTVSSASVNNGEFVLSGISLPVTLAAGQSTPFTVTFTPQASGATSASLSFSSNAANSPAVQSMTGTGTPPPQHTVDLTWNSSNNAVGYNVYRSSVSGGPYSIVNSSLDGATAYTDNTVASGQTYYYVATAVDGSSNESGYSTETQAVIPNP
jgi:hypothetical protein